MTRDRIRAWLGTDHIPHLEEHMATILEALKAIGEQQQALSAAQLTSFTNLQNAIQRLEQAVRDGDIPAEAQAALADINEAFRVMQDNVSRADDGYEPVTPDSEGVPPVDEDPTVPVEDPPVVDEQGDTGTTSRRR